VDSGKMTFDSKNIAKKLCDKNYLIFLHFCLNFGVKGHLNFNKF
jgi:hypothetical protein